MLTYLAHFPGEMSVEAHSFFRYNTHLSLVLVLSLALAARDLGIAGWAVRRWHCTPLVPIVAALVVPVVTAPLLRFDLDMPQPLVWDMAKRLAPLLQDGDRLALLLPGDNDSVATMLSGVLRDTAPRRHIDVLRRTTADAATLDDAAAAGYRLAFISCTPSGEAMLLTHDDAGWRTLASWPYPAAVDTRHWQRFLSWKPLCRSE
jgi:hypothetical protein